MLQIIIPCLIVVAIGFIFAAIMAKITGSGELAVGIFLLSILIAVITFFFSDPTQQAFLSYTINYTV